MQGGKLALIISDLFQYLYILFQSKGTITEDLEIADVLSSLHQDVEQTLFPLMPLLQSCLSKKDVKDLVKEMFTLKHLTRGSFIF